MANRGGEGAALTLPQALQHAAAALQRGDAAEAERACRRILEARPESFDALYLMGIAAGQGRRPGEAAEWFARAAALQPRNADVQFNLGVALGESGRGAEALEAYERTVALDPARADAHYNRGVALEALGRSAEALAAYERAVAIAPAHAEAHHNRGVVLARLGRAKEALGAFDRALTARPRHPAAHVHRAIALLDLDRAPEALESAERAIALAPGHAHAWYIRGNALRELSRHADAAGSFERAIAIEPAHAAAHANLADCRLVLGDFARGWEEYQWRLALPARGRRDFAEPLWTGTGEIAGRTILLHAELGLGDALQFCRYANEVARLGARVLLQVPAPLVPLLATLEGVESVHATGDALPAFDLQCPLMSLPLALRSRLEGVPAQVPYLKSDPARVARWRERLGEKRAPRVGLVWRGSQGLANDKRSMALAELLPVLRPGIEWVSLQKDVPEAEAAALAASALRDVSDGLADFAETAAVVELLDLLVSVDTSVVHVAGALARPVWILLPHNPHDWRWLLEREDSLWYPTARLLRQPRPGDWASVVRRAGDQVATHFHV